MSTTATPSPTPEYKPAPTALPPGSALDEKTTAWRKNELTRAGYPAEMVVVLAPRGDIDLHLAVTLLRQGCKPALALRILV